MSSTAAESVPLEAKRGAREEPLTRLRDNRDHHGRRKNSTAYKARPLQVSCPGFNVEGEDQRVPR